MIEQFRSVTQKQSRVVGRGNDWTALTTPRRNGICKSSKVHQRKRIHGYGCISRFLWVPVEDDGIEYTEPKMN